MKALSGKVPRKDNPKIATGKAMNRGDFRILFLSTPYRL